MGAVFSLQNIVVSRGDTFLLTVRELDLAANRIHVVTGPNGAGKSTLLQTLALLIPAQSGSLYVFGQRIGSGTKELVAIRQRLTLVEQSPYLLQGTVAGNLAFGLKLRRIGRQEQHQRIEQALDTVGLAGFANRRAKELSGGETQRVALARALVLKPRVLLLDEPTANIDRDSLSDFEQLLRNLPATGTTVILSTHDRAQAQRLEGSVIKINNGTVGYRD